MTNADKFKSIFGLYATELWAKPEKDFLEWLNADAELFGNSELMDCSDCVEHGGDWECDHVQCRKGTDTINRHGAIKAIKDALLSWSNMPGWRDNKIVGALDKLPSAQQNCDGCKWSDAIGYGECHHCKRAFEDMYEKGEQP